ncbi:hypothetical protein HDU76_009926 [Blyttiomyces sp. JEL0837]|nr:hypothetical protein HDU76_009926 [Blyttiomyces sp. JEL0837]
MPNRPTAKQRLAPLFTTETCAEDELAAKAFVNMVHMNPLQTVTNQTHATLIPAEDGSADPDCKALRLPDLHGCSEDVSIGMTIQHSVLNMRFPSVDDDVTGEVDDEASFAKTVASAAARPDSSAYRTDRSMWCEFEV